MSLSERLVWSSIRLGARVFYGDTTQADWIYEKVRRPRTLWLVARNMLNYRLGRPRVAALVTLGVEPVFGCNLKCKYCWGAFEEGLAGTRPRLMEWDLFRKAVDEAPDTVETVTFGSVGEPLLHPRRFPGGVRGRGAKALPRAWGLGACPRIGSPLPPAHPGDNRNADCAAHV